METEDPADSLRAKVQTIADMYDADVFAFVGILFETIDTRVIRICRKRKTKRKNVILILSTPGGSADAAYRIARCFQRCYQTVAPKIADRGEFYIYVHDMCASAGTLLALGATKLIMSQQAQLGPIDVQLRKDEEVGERRSGLTSRQALETLASEAGRSFARLFRSMRFEDGVQLPTRMAGEFAAQMTVNMMEPIYAQIDPMKLGETERYVKISQEYGERLRSPNVRKNTIEKLLAGYPSHEFVIDREEASILFENVGHPSDDLEDVASAMIRDFHPTEDRPGFFNYLSVEIAGAIEEADDVQTADPALGEGAKGTGPDGGKIRPSDEGSAAGKQPAPTDGNGVLAEGTRPRRPRRTGNIGRQGVQH